MLDEEVTRFMRIFRGSERSYGRYRADNGAMSTAREPYGYQQFFEHVTGVTGLGIVPVLEDATCAFSVIDIDAHGGGAEPIDINAIERGLSEATLPLIPCRSKSGGVHVYAFYRDPMPAHVARKFMAQVLLVLKLPSSTEVFPKQERLAEGQLGNWINLPYFGESRYAQIGGRTADLRHFLDHVEANAIGADDLEAIRTRLDPTSKKNASQAEKAADYADAPPCIQKMVLDGVPKGENVRNRALFAAAVFLKRAYADDWESRLEAFNHNFLSVPLERLEVRKLVGQQRRNTYSYKCREEPCVSRCDRGTCLTRKFGITPAEANVVSAGSLFVRMVKTLSIPPTYDGHRADGGCISLDLEELMHYHLFRKAVFAKWDMVLPAKEDRWEDIQRELMAKIEHTKPTGVDMPELMRDQLVSFCSGYATPKPTDDVVAHRRAMLTVGKPVLMEYNEEKVIAFRSEALIRHLKNNRMEEMKGNRLWAAFAPLGIRKVKINVGSGERMKTHIVPYKGIFPSDDTEMKAVEYQPEL